MWIVFSHGLAGSVGLGPSSLSVGARMRMAWEKDLPTVGVIAANAAMLYFYFAKSENRKDD